MTRASHLTALAALMLALVGCPEGSAVAQNNDAGPPVDAGASDAQSTTPWHASSSTPSSPPAEPSSEHASLELLQLTLTSDVQKKEPVDTLDVAPPGTRVYAHLKLRNRSQDKRKVHVDFFVNGKLRTPLDLTVEPSWSFRTWGYNTMQAGDTGELEVRVLDDGGTTLATARLPIKAKSKAK
ncbi:hypothetical protein [Polyangium mundeleinium]|uniref:Uncharacterized protein n=1 Tax=Polyangium mundeleinium TaxID=2995306 RepID=A0ABT5EE04_9BACT|nr:hypothetical protein [Polyangium mundeleinium]MDC0739734.1 hypothetical protein [Polyangium mundeleinium]